MSGPERVAARTHIEDSFRAAVDRDVTAAALERCQRLDLRAVGGYFAADRLAGADRAVSELVWQAFVPAWDEVVYEYETLHGQATRFLACKALALVEYAQSGGHATPRVRDTAAHATRELAALWRVWAGHMATTSDALAHAVTEFRVEA